MGSTWFWIGVACVFAVAVIAFVRGAGRIGDAFDADLADPAADLLSAAQEEKLRLIAIAMKADREEGFASYMKTPIGVVPRIRPEAA
jgi:hypothetical protein